MGDYHSAIEYTKLTLALQKKLKDKAFQLTNLIELNILAKDCQEGHKIVIQLNKMFKQFEEWQKTGLGRNTIYQAFNLSLICNDKKNGTKIFQMAEQWFKKNQNIALIGLETAWEAAKKWNITNASQKYEKLVNIERSKIEALI